MSDLEREALLRVAGRYGSVEYHNLQDLMPRHRSILQRVLTNVHLLAVAEAEVETHHGERPARYLQEIERRDPYFTFLIDGPRGSGKTSLTLTIGRYLSLCGAPDEYASSLLQAQVSKQGLTELEACIKTQVGQRLPIQEPILVNGQRRRLAHRLPLLRPDDMETSESIMEGVFAQMAVQLREAEKQEKERQRSGDGSAGETTRVTASSLLKRLNDEVAKGWYFSREMGVEALLNDSLNFHEYIERRSQEATASHDRARVWRRFVVAYLDYFRSQFLTILVDDTDASPERTVDLLDSIRKFFCHPRIVTIVAGNLSAIRHRLLIASFSHLQKASRTLRAGDSFTAKYWRDFERSDIEEYLAKTFPRSGRNFITLTDRDVGYLLGDVRRKNSAKTDSDDKDSDTRDRCMTFAEFCRQHMQCRFTKFFDLHLDTRALAREQGPQQRFQGQFEDKDSLAENYLALWLLRNHYASRLRPASARHLNQLRLMLDGERGLLLPDASVRSRDAASTDGGQETANEGKLSRKRVAVSIFSDPSNYAILGRMDEYSPSAVDWLQQQEIRSAWRGTKYIQVNKLTLHENTPPYYFLLFRLDLELAMPRWSNQNIDLPRALLPDPSGRTTWTPEVWEKDTRKYIEARLQKNHFKLRDGRLRLRQNLLGLARIFSHPLIPANFLYYKDAHGLPDLAWEHRGDDPPSTRSYPLYPVHNIDSVFRLRRHDPRNDYFRIVALFASIPISPPVPAKEFSEKPWQLLDVELGGVPCVDSILDPRKYEQQDKQTENAQEGFFESKAAHRAKEVVFGSSEPSKPFAQMQEVIAEHLIKAAPTYDEPVKDNGAIPSIRARIDTLAEALHSDFGPTDYADQERLRRYYKDLVRTFISGVVPHYHRIVNDVRRAHHAMRILENDLIAYGRVHGANGKSNSLAIRNSNTNEPTGTGDPGHDDKQAKPGSDQDGANGRPRDGDSAEYAPHEPFTHSRNDRYHLIDVTKLREILGLPRYSLNRTLRDATGNPPGELYRLIDSEDADELRKNRRYPALWTEVLRVGKKRCTPEAVHGGENHQVAQSSAKDKASQSTIQLQIYPEDTTAAPQPYWLRREDCWSDSPERQGEDDSSPPSLSSEGGDIPDTDGSIAHGDLAYFQRYVIGTRIDDWTQLRPTFKRLFDPFEKDGLTDRAKARNLRSVLLFLWGLGPSLSSLIHLELMGERIYWEQQIKNIDQTSLAKARQNECETALIELWEETLRYARWLVLLFGCAMEDMYVQGFTNREKRDQKKDVPANKQVRFLAAPDFGIATLGMRLFERNDAGGHSDEVAPRSGSFEGIVGDTLLRIGIAEDYLLQCRDMLHGGNGNDRSKASGGDPIEETI